MDRPQLSPGYRAPSPPRRQRACVPCTRAKAKCNFQALNIKRHLCDRCEKLELDCSAKTTKSLRKSRKIKDTPNALATLEYRIGRDDQPLRRVGRSVQSQKRVDSSSLPTVDSRGVDGSATEHPHQRTRSGPPSDLQHPKTPSLPPYNITWLQASHILSLFQSHYAPNFPFVIIDPKMTAESLYKEKPCLFRAVMLVAGPLPEPRIAKMKRNVLAYLGQHMLVEEERRLELLQGLLVVIAWSHMCHIYDEQVTNLTYMALGYAHNLGLTKIPIDALPKRDSNSVPEDMPANSRVRENPKVHSQEEQRALLGVFCILSANSTQYTRRNPLETPYIDFCCTFLTTMYSPTHLLLERTVRMIQMSEKLSRAFGEAHERSHARPWAFLLEGSGRRFRTELNRIIEMAMHPDLAEYEGFFQLWHNYLLARLYEPATKVKELEAEGIGPSMYRSLCLRNCLDAVKTYFDILLSGSATATLYRTVLTSEQCAFVMLMATRLLLIDAPDWDVQLARLSLDFLPILDRILERVHEADAARRKAVEAFAKDTGGVVTEEEMGVESRLADTARKTKWLREGFQARLEGRVLDGLEVAEERRGAVMEEESRDDGVMWLNGFLGNMAWSFDGVNI